MEKKYIYGKTKNQMSFKQGRQTVVGYDEYPYGDWREIGIKIYFIFPGKNEICP